MGKGDKWMVFLRRGFSCAESMRKPIPNPKTNRKKQTILTRFESSWSFKQTKLLCGICRIRSSLPCECACDRWVDGGYGMPKDSQLTLIRWIVIVPFKFFLTHFTAIVAKVGLLANVHSFETDEIWFGHVGLYVRFSLKEVF